MMNPVGEESVYPDVGRLTGTEGENVEKTECDLENEKKAENGGYGDVPPLILEHIFRFLNGRDAAAAMDVCKSWREILIERADWKTYYRSLWKRPTEYLMYMMQTETGGMYSKRGGLDWTRVWKRLFDMKFQQVLGYQYKPERYSAYGHKAGVKVVKMLPSFNLMLTGSVDRRLVLWDMEHFSYAGVSLPHAGTVRCLAIDESILATGSTDHRIRIWNAHYGSDEVEECDLEDARYLSPSFDDVRRLTEAEMEYMSSRSNSPSHLHASNPRRCLPKKFPFDVSGRRVVLGDGHNGPVSSLELSDCFLFSGSWDYSVRIWDRRQASASYEEGESIIQCSQIVHFDDWVLDLKRQKDTLYAAAGADVHVIDLGKGEAIKTGTLAHHTARSSPVTALSLSEDGNTMFYGNGEGGIFACDVRAKGHHSQAQFECSSAVTGLSFEYPWLAGSLQSGEVVLLNTDSMLKLGTKRNQPFSRILVGGCSGGAQCVDIAESRISGGFEDGTVVTWDFINAEKAAKELQILRQRKKAAREAKKLLLRH